MEHLPVCDILPQLRAALAAQGLAVLQAPPGAGKTTMVPLDLLKSTLFTGKILVLEPRRLAARASAERMAQLWGEPVGQTIGYRIRGEAKISAQTQIEVVTEGILTRMIQSDPELPGIACVIFDEFHERSLHADLGLALCLEIRAALRPDLALLVMSATLDAAPIAKLMGEAALVTSEGRAYEVETHWLPRPVDPSLRFEGAMAGLIRHALDETQDLPGAGLLAFCPGEGEIRRLETALSDRQDIEIKPLFGAMDFAAQRAAFAPSQKRKVILATSIAETSLTLPDIRVVVDGGRARRARFDPASGMSRLVTERVTKAEATQRQGRAGRTNTGHCYRMWSKGEEGALAAYPLAEIEAADLTALALELALWGSQDLPFLTPPDPARMAEAKALLESLGALRKGLITDHGRALVALPLHPRLGHMLIEAGANAATLAALLEERDPLQGAGVDLSLRLKAVQNPPASAHRGRIEAIRQAAKRLARLAPVAGKALSSGAMAALAYPDRIGLRRAGDAARYLLSGGKGAVMAEQEALAKSRLIVATDLDGDPREAKIRQALPLEEAELRALYGPQITWREKVEWSKRDGRILAKRQECYGALVLNERNWTDAPADAMALAALQGLRDIGLPWTPNARRLRARIELARDETWPDVSDEALLETGEEWLLPYLSGLKTEGDLRNLDLTEALKSLIGWDNLAHLDRLVPSHFTTPLGRAVPIDYEGEYPAIAIRLQEMFGVTQHPKVGQKRQPLRVTLLSPAQRPVQVTLDLPGFWANSYSDVRKDMRGQYPRHPWPEDPTQAEPTLRAKPRGT